MTVAYFHLPGVAGASVGDVLVLDGAEGHHAAVVRRLVAGEQLVLTDGEGTVAHSRVLDVERGTLRAEVLELAQVAAEMPRVVVVQAVPKGERGELAVEMLTE